MSKHSAQFMFYVGCIMWRMSKCLTFASWCINLACCSVFLWCISITLSLFLYLLLSLLMEKYMFHVKRRLNRGLFFFCEHPVSVIIKEIFYGKKPSSITFQRFHCFHYLCSTNTKHIYTFLLTRRIIFTSVT